MLDISKTAFDMLTNTEGELRFDRYVKLKLPTCSYASLQKHIRCGRIRVDGRKVAPGYSLKGGESIRFPTELLQACQGSHKQTIPFVTEVNQSIKGIDSWCVYRDESWLVINKPSGIESQPGGHRADLDTLLKTWLAPQGKKPYGVHRLDYLTSGLVIVALSRTAAAWGAQQFREHRVQKKYYACVAGHPPLPKGRMIKPLLHPQEIGRRCAVQWGKGKEAETHYRVCATQGPYSFLELHPITGRRHQLRAHCASEGWPIVGDQLYGGPRASELRLCAYFIAWQQMDGCLREVKLPPPAWMKGAI